MGLRSWRNLLIASLAVLVGGPLARPLVAADAGAVLAALDSINADELKQFVSVLADDSFEGREAGSRGGRAAGVYLVQQLQRLGLKSAVADGSYYQPFEPNCRNILAVLEGSDPELSKQYIVIGAHYDHVGYGNRRNSFGPIGYIHNGADDNASGSSALIETAQAFTRLGTAPKRSIIFALWDGEEQGLWGSKNWLVHPTVPLDKVVGALNMDMVGRLRDNRLYVYGARTGAGFRHLVALENRDDNLLLDFNWEIKADSDHYPFFAQGIPFLMLHTGLHADYHKPSDDVEKINAEGMRLVSRLAFEIALELADEPAVPKFREASRRESPDTQRQNEQMLPALPGRFGVSWDDADKSVAGLKITQVAPGSAAAKAGLQFGDRLLKFAGEEITDSDQFRSLVVTAHNPVSVEIQRTGEEKPRDLTVTLAGEPLRVGITWRTDDAEPGCVYLNRVAVGSPADRAGLKAGDRIYAVTEHEFANSEEFQSLLATLPTPLELLVERRGQLKTVELALPPMTP